MGRPPHPSLTTPVQILGAAPLILLLGCSSAVPSRFVHAPPTDVFSAAVDAGPPIDDADVLALPEAAKVWLETEFGPPGRPSADIVRRLAAAFSPGGSLALRYEELGAYTAAETFERRAGNCLAHAHLFIALARAWGIDASYREVLKPPQWNRRGSVMVWSRHVGAHIDTRRHGTFHVDFAGLAQPGLGWGRRISDDLARAQHFNNLGAAALISGRLDEGLRAFRRALLIDASLPYVWSNLGLAHQRAGRAPVAEWSWRRAVELDRYHFPALNALESFYRRTREAELAAAFAELAKEARWGNPFTQYELGIAALKKGNARAAIIHLRSAADNLPKQLPVQLELARAYFAAEKYREAKGVLETATALALTRDDRMLLNRTLAELAVMRGLDAEP